MNSVSVLVCARRLPLVCSHGKYKLEHGRVKKKYVQNALSFLSGALISHLDKVLLADSKVIFVWSSDKPSRQSFTPFSSRIVKIT